jgi:TRAP-type C4-dicarboxylate transport system permease small subunit
MLGGALALRRRAHLGVDALVRAYPRKVRFALDYFSTALLAAFSLAVMVCGGYLVCDKAVSTHSMTPGLETFNQAWFYAALPVAGALNFIYCIHAFFHPKPIGMDLDEDGDE